MQNWVRKTENAGMEYAAGVICEYNPFHRGHAHHLRAARAAVHGGPVVCVMSGPFVQRGDAAVLSAHARARAAVHGGASLVLELPLPWAVSGAERFARGGVSILASLGVVGTLSFGSECGDADALWRAACLADDERLPEAMRAHLDAGMSFAAARQRAVELLDSASARLLSSPNNTLGIEYLRAARFLGASFGVHTVVRAGDGHDTPVAHSDIASASAVRALLAGGGDFVDYLPQASAGILREEMDAGRAPVWLDTLETVLLARLRAMSAADFAQLPDVSEGLEHRLARSARAATGLEDFIAGVKSKRYTYARLRRIAVAAMLGLRAQDAAGRPPYARVLAFNDEGRVLLRRIGEVGTIPVVTKPATLRGMDGACRALDALEAYAGDLWTLACPARGQRVGGQRYRQSPIYVQACPDTKGGI